MKDSDIIALYRERNESAISETAEKYGNYCKKIAENILQNEQDAEECVNTAYLKVWEKIPPEKPDIFSAFLARVTRNTALDTHRKNYSRKRGSGGISLILDELGDCVSDKETPEAAAENRELLREINKFLKGQPKKHRMIFVSRYCLLESIKEIAAKYAMSEDNVSVHLSRTRKKLREHLEKEGYEL